MKFIIFAVVALVLLALLSIGFYQLYDLPFKAINETREKPTIEFIDKKDLRIESAKCTNLDIEIQTIIDAPQNCKKHEDCSQLMFNGRSQLNMINYQNAKSLTYKRSQECPSLVQTITINSSPSENFINSHVECIKNTCTEVLNLSTTTEIRKLLKEVRQ